MRHVAVVLLALMLTIAVCSAPSWSQEETLDPEQLIARYASTITPYRLVDQMRDLAENHREEGLQAFQDILEHADEYPNHVMVQQVLGAMVEHFGDDEPRRIFTEWLLTTDSERFVEDLRAPVGWEPFREPEWLRGVYEHAAEHAASQRIRYALIRRLNIELTGEELEAYLRSDQGLYDSLRTAAACYVPVADPSDLDRRRVERTLEAMQNVLTNHGEHYDIFHLHRGVYLWLLDRDAEALADLDAYIDLHPEAPYPHHHRARVLAEMGDIEGARAAEATYLAKTEAVEPLVIELPDLPDELPETDLSARDPSWLKWLAPPDSVEFAEAVEAANADIDPVKLARAVASSNADDRTRSYAVQVLQKGFDPQELGETVPWLEIAVRRRVTSGRRLCELLAAIGHASSAAAIADLAATDPSPRLRKLLMMFPEEIARPLMLRVAMQNRDWRWLSTLNSLYPAEKKYWRVQWELIATRGPEERLYAAATDKRMLGDLTLYEMATDLALAAAMRADALQTLRDARGTRPRQVVVLVETAQAAEE